MPTAVGRIILRKTINYFLISEGDFWNWFKYEKWPRMWSFYLQILSPLHLLFSPFLQYCIYLWEALRSKKSLVCGKWTGVWRAQDHVLVRIDERRLRYGVVAPENEDDVFLGIWEESDYFIGEGFPSFPLVWCRLSFAHSKYAVEQKHSLIRPVSKICRSALNPEITLELLEDILEAWLCFWSVRYGERESHRSSWSVVGILPEDDDANLLGWCEIEGTEDIFPFWKTRSGWIFVFYELRKCLPIGFLEFFCEQGIPGWVNSNRHESINKSTKLDEIGFIYTEMNL